MYSQYLKSQFRGDVNHGDLNYAELFNAVE